MKLVGNFEYIGIEEIKGKKDPTKTYFNVVLMQEYDVVKIFINEETALLFKGVVKLDKLQCTLKISIGSEKTYINVLEVKKL